MSFHEFHEFFLSMQVSTAISHSQTVPPPPLHKGGTTTNNNTASAAGTPTTNSDEAGREIARATADHESSATALTSLAAASTAVSPLVTSSCFTSSAAMSAAVATSGFGRDFRDFGLGGISAAATRHHSTTLDRYPYLSQTS